MTRREEAGLAVHDGEPRAGGVARLAEDVAVGRVVPDLALGDAFPERTQPFEASLWRVAGDDRRVDGADRHAAHPARFEPTVLQRLIDPGLVGTERPAALQHQGNPVTPFRPVDPTGRLP